MFAGFETIVDTGAADAPGYIDGIVLAVPEANREAYRAFNEHTAAIFREYGALRIVENWGDPVPDGQVTDFNRATLRQDGERVVFSWIEWPGKDARDAAWGKIMEDERMKPPADMGFDGKRMMWGGFTPVLDTAAR
nr:DUF1428 domain-containing protein [Sphingomonas sp.]